MEGSPWKSLYPTRRTSPSTSRLPRRFATRSSRGSCGRASIRALATSLRISAITTKRAYSDLEAQGYIHTVPGKGCFVAGDNLELLREERLRLVEGWLSRAVADARMAGVTDDELREMLELQLEDEQQ